VGADSPHTPKSDECRRPRRGAPAADQLPALLQKERTGNLPSEGPTRRPSDSEQKRGGGGIAFDGEPVLNLNVEIDQNYLVFRENVTQKIKHFLIVKEQWLND